MKGQIYEKPEMYNIASLQESFYEEALRHFELLQLDALNKIYLPYMKSEFKWTNDEKRYILNKMKEKNKEFLPSEAIHLLNEFKQKVKS